ncbi:MAG: M48 family metalloprotease [Myxococcales bacterium]|nr:M48 family metalloprotease [Myxococcales bacterium]
MLRLFSSVALVAFLLGCTTLTVEDERRMSDDFERKVKSEVVLMRDRTVVDYVDRIAREILRAAGPQAFDYEFQVIENEAINAFAGPGGKIFLHTGVITKAKNVSELAGVLAHEIGHVAERHVAENYARARPVNLGKQVAVQIAGVLAGRNAAGAANIAGSLAEMTYLNKFGREAEAEADAFAVDVMIKAGYDPRGLVTFFKTLEGEGGGSPPEFLSSHPTTGNRIATTSALIRARSLPAGLRTTDGGRFDIVKRRVLLLTGKEKPGVPQAVP